MVIARKIAYNVLVSSVCKVLSTVLALVSIGFITRYLGKEGFGNYATVLAFLSFFAAAADLGLYQISTREISRPGADERKILGNIVSLRILSSLVILLVAPLVTIFFDYPAEVKRGIVIVAASFVFSSGYQVLNGIFQKNLAMNRVAIAELLGKAIQLAVIILAVKLSLGFDWIMGSLLVYMLFTSAVVFGLSRRFVRFKLSFDLEYWKTFLRQSLPMGIAAVITFAYFKMDTIILSVLKSGADVGIYNAAYKVLENITFFPAMIIGLVLPIFSHSIFSDRQKFQDTANKTFKVFVILAVPLIVGTLFLADPVIGLIGGGGFAESAAILRILVFALALIFFGHFFNALLIAGNLQKKLMSVLAAAAGINITLNLIFIPSFSYLAAAYISVLTELIVVGLTFFLTYHELKYFPRMERALGILAAGFCMGVFLYVFRDINFFLSALASAAVYFVSLWLFQAVKSSEITSIISRKGVEEYEEIP